MSASALPDWQLPPGVDRGLWHYTHSRDLAEGYDDSLEGSTLIEADIAFCERHFHGTGSLVDLGCGTGRLAIHFAQRGWQCVGVDLSREMLDVAARKATVAGVAVRWVEANLVELDVLEDHSFQAAGCLFSTLGMLRGRAARLRMLQHTRRILQPGGTLVLHVHNRWFLGWRGVWMQALRDIGRSITGRPDLGDRTALMPRAGANVTLHHFSRREAINDLREVGFEIIEVQPIGLSGPLRTPIAATWRAYGYLISARSPKSAGC